MTEPTNRDRGERAIRILAAYNANHNGADGDLTTSAVDLTADILHAADLMTGWDGAALIDRARMHHAAEAAEEHQPHYVVTTDDGQNAETFDVDTLDDVRQIVADATVTPGTRVTITRNAEPLDDPTPHLEAGHAVVVYFQEETAGWVHRNREGLDEVYDTESLESGPTDEAACRTCSVALDPEGFDL